MPAAQHVVRRPGGPIHRQVLAGQQVAAQRPHPRPIAGRRTSLGGEGSLGGGPAATLASLGPMLGHGQAQRRQVEHLPGHDPDHHRIGQLAAAPLAAVRHMPDHLVGLWDLGQMGTGRAGLLARRTATLGPPTTALPGPRGLSRTVRGRWLGGVGGVLAQAAFQLCHAGRKLGVSRHQPGVGLAQLVDHHRLDRDGGLQTQIGEEITASWTPADTPACPWAYGTATAHRPGRSTHPQCGSIRVSVMLPATRPPSIC